MEKQAKVVQLKTQLVKEGHTRTMLAETDLMTLRIHCYAPGIGENALHSHTKEDHIFLVLQGTAQFNTGRANNGERGQELRCRAAGGLLLPVLQLGHRALGHGAHRGGPGQSGSAAES